MKKILGIALMFMIMTVLSGCLVNETTTTGTVATTDIQETTIVSATTTTTTTIATTQEMTTTTQPNNNEEEDELYTGYASDFQYDITKASSSSLHYFNANFKDITYRPIMNNICLTVDISDSNYRNATYYYIFRKAGTYQTLTQSSFTISNSSTSNRECFNGMKSSSSYEILMTKYDGDETYSYDYQNMVILPSVTTMAFHLPSYNERHIASVSIQDEELPNMSTAIKAGFKFDLNINDTEKSFTKLHVSVIYQRFNKIVYSEDIIVNDSDYINGALSYENIEVNDLAPNTDYLVVVYGTGNDGVDDFDDITLNTRIVKSNTYSANLGAVYHGLYGVLLGYQIEESTTKVHYLVENTGEVISNLDNQPFTTFLNIYTASNGDLVKSYPLDKDQNDIDIENTYLKEGYYIMIDTDRNNIRLSSQIIQYDLPKITNYRTEGNVLTFQLSNSSMIIHSIDIQFETTYNGEPFQTFTDVTLQPGTNTLTLNRDMSDIDYLYSSYTISFEGLNGLEQKTLYLAQTINY